MPTKPAETKHQSRLISAYNTVTARLATKVTARRRFAKKAEVTSSLFLLIRIRHNERLTAIPKARTGTSMLSNRRNRMAAGTVANPEDLNIFPRLTSLLRFEETFESLSEILWLIFERLTLKACIFIFTAFGNPLCSLSLHIKL